MGGDRGDAPDDPAWFVSQFGSDFKLGKNPFHIVKPDGTSDLTPKQQEEAAAIFSNIFDGESYYKYKLQEAAKRLISGGGAKSGETTSDKPQSTGATSYKTQSAREEIYNQREEQLEQRRRERAENKAEASLDSELPMAMKKADEADNNQASPKDKRAVNYAKCKEQSSQNNELYLTDDAQALFYHGKPFYIVKPNDVKYTESARLNPSVDEVSEALSEVEAKEGRGYISSGELAEKELSDIIRRNRGEAVLLDTVEFQVDWHDWVTAIIKGNRVMAGDSLADDTIPKSDKFDSHANQPVSNTLKGVAGLAGWASGFGSEINKENRFLVNLYQTGNVTQAVLVVHNEKAPQYLIPNSDGEVVAVGDYLCNGGLGTYKSKVEEHFYKSIRQAAENEDE